MTKHTKELPNNLRRINIPFGGFYQSHYWGDAEEDVYCDDWNDDVLDKWHDILDGKGRQVEVLISKDYLACMNGSLEEYYKVSDLLSEPMVHPMNMQNADDNISAIIDINKLPPLSEIERIANIYSVDFRSLLIQIAKDKLTSRDGFISFYNPNIEPIFNWTYDAWEDVYITCLLDAMVAVIGMEEAIESYSLEEWNTACYDFEFNKFYCGDYQDTGGIHAYQWEVLSQDEADEVNEILEGS